MSEVVVPFFASRSECRRGLPSRWPFIGFKPAKSTPAKMGDKQLAVVVAVVVVVVVAVLDDARKTCARPQVVGRLHINSTGGHLLQAET